MVTPKRGKGAARKGPGRMRSTRSQKLASDEEDAADEAAAAAAPEPGLTTRRSLRSRTTSHKIDPTQFAEDDEADEEKEERSSPGAGAADAAQAGGNRSRDGSAEGTHGTASQAAADSAGAATESKGDSDDNVPLAQIAEADAKKKRPAPSPAAAARKRQKAGSKPAAPAPAVKAEVPPAAAPEKAGPAAKRAKKQPDQASADRDASPAAPAGKPAQKSPAEDAAAKSGTAVKPLARPAQQQKQHTVAQQPKQQQKSMQPASAAAAVESGQGNEGGEGKKHGEQSLDPMTLQGKQISDELDKAFGEFHALQKKQADIAHKVQGYLGHLDSMHFSIQQLRETMVGRSVKKISKWQLESTCRDAAAHAKQLCDVWMKETKDRQVAPAENRSKPQPATKAPIPAVRVPNQEQKTKSQVLPTTEAKTNVTSLAAAPNALSLRIGQGVAAAPSREPTASTAAPAASKKLQEAREWCLQHLTPAPTGNALRDQGVLILWTALMPHAELPPAEAARKLEAAVHDYYARGNGDNAVADPGADYMRRLRVLWSWLSPDSQHAEPQLKRMLLQGEVSAEEVASLNGQQLEALVKPPAAANGGATEPHAAASEQLPAASEEPPPPPPPPPADVPDLAAAANLARQLPAAFEQPPPPPGDVPDLAAASAANVARQPEPVTPAGSPWLGEGMQPRGWQSAPPGSDLKAEFSRKGFPI
ncbi:hypothetical protein WJX75_005983 [Coccomyxa subellipsoidea]|uniref:TFIIS N-terminal domain-containing protein n=1 Tax=Coccomyxa subellipsoidea TaxID=248742 RepID=A0ABR2YE74_9CHLO